MWLGEGGVGGSSGRFDGKWQRRSIGVRGGDVVTVAGRVGVEGSEGRRGGGTVVAGCVGRGCSGEDAVPSLRSDRIAEGGAVEGAGSRGPTGGCVCD